MNEEVKKDESLLKGDDERRPKKGGIVKNGVHIMRIFLLCACPFTKSREKMKKSGWYMILSGWNDPLAKRMHVVTYNARYITNKM